MYFSITPHYSYEYTAYLNMQTYKWKSAQWKHYIFRKPVPSAILIFHHIILYEEQFAESVTDYWKYTANIHHSGSKHSFLKTYCIKQNAANMGNCY